MRALRGRLAYAGGVVTLAGLLAFAVAIPSADADDTGKPCGISSPIGERTIPLVDQGQSRPFPLFVPQGYDGRHRVPLILNLHLRLFNGATQMRITQMGPAADQRGFAVAAPTGAVVLGPESYTWNTPGVSPAPGITIPAGTPDDEQYLLHVIRAAKHSLCIDKKRIYLAGYSAGAWLASTLACDHPKKIAGVAAVAGLRAGLPEQTPSGGWRPDRKTCRPEQPVPTLAFHGTADQLTPYGGEVTDPNWRYGVERALGRWAKINRCQRGPRTKATTASVTLISYRDCEAHASVSLYREEAAGHTWPGSTFPPLGPIDQTIDATALMLRFFADHRRSENVDR